MLKDNVFQWQLVGYVKNKSACQFYIRIDTLYLVLIYMPQVKNVNLTSRRQNRKGVV